MHDVWSDAGSIGALLVADGVGAAGVAGVGDWVAAGSPDASGGVYPGAPAAPPAVVWAAELLVDGPMTVSAVRPAVATRTRASTLPSSGVPCPRLAARVCCPAHARFSRPRRSAPISPRRRMGSSTSDQLRAASATMITQSRTGRQGESSRTDSGRKTMTGRCQR